MRRRIKAAKLICLYDYDFHRIIGLKVYLRVTDRNYDPLPKQETNKVVAIVSRVLQKKYEVQTKPSAAFQITVRNPVAVREAMNLVKKAIRAAGYKPVKD